jgi:predicted nuclease of predicted toxin-antitoxin system
MGFKILADTNMPFAVVEQLRLRGVEAEYLIHLLPENTKDPDILEYAYENGFTIITYDKKIQSHVNERAEAGKEHPGVFIALDHLQGSHGIGKIVEELGLWHEAIAGGAASLEDEVYNQVRWIS